MKELLQVENLTVAYGQVLALKGVTLTVGAAEAVALVGANGAGKSTLFKSIVGFLRPRSGRLSFLGRDMSGVGPERRARLGLGYAPEGRRVFPGLTVRENLLLAARSGPIDETRLRWIFGLFPALEKFWPRAAGVLSGGQKQMLSIARAIIEPRKLFLIDEPTKGLAPAIIANMIAAFRELKKSADTTILVVEQNFLFAKSLGDAVAVMDNGRIVHTGAMAELAEDRDLQHRLLGLHLDQHQ